MRARLNCIMLIDDNPDDNFIHERTIRKNCMADVVIKKESGVEALQYLREKGEAKEAHPELIFLDINMPQMNGWEFLEEYKKLDKELQSKVIVVMLTTSENPDDAAKAAARNSISEFKTKPLTREILEEVIDKYF